MAQSELTLHVTPEEYRELRVGLDRLERHPGAETEKELCDRIFGPELFDRMAYKQTEVQIHFDGILPEDRITPALQGSWAGHIRYHGPAHENTFDLATGVSTFKEISAEQCAKAPDKKHDWSGPVVSTGFGQSVTCAHCGMTAMDWDMRYAP